MSMAFPISVPTPQILFVMPSEPITSMELLPVFNPLHLDIREIKSYCQHSQGPAEKN